MSLKSQKFNIYDQKHGQDLRITTIFEVFNKADNQPTVC